MGRRHSRNSKPQVSKRDRHRLDNQEMTDLLVRYERANQRDHEQVWR